MGWPKWRHTLNEAKRLAIKALDEYNCSTGHYGDFIGTMVRAWLYLLQAEFQRDKIDYSYKDQEGNPIMIDREPKLWDVLKSAKERFPATTTPSGSTWNCSSRSETRSSTGTSTRSKSQLAAAPMLL